MVPVLPATRVPWIVMETDGSCLMVEKALSYRTLGEGVSLIEIRSDVKPVGLLLSTPDRSFPLRHIGPKACPLIRETATGSKWADSRMAACRV
jgi:hypothetical protein